VAALLRFVPYVGIWIAASLAVIMAAAVGSGWSMMIWTLVLFAGSEVLAAQLAEPLLYGRSTGLSPFAVIVAAIFWSWIWGPVGLVLSTPLTLCLVILGRHAPHLEFLDVLFGDRPALTPAENFYQRLLANDPQAAFAQAESLVKARGLTAYYDTVALDGLRQARHDLLRGVITAEQLRRIKASTLDLVRRLDDAGGEVMQLEHVGAKHGAARALHPGKRGVGVPSALCIGGRGKLDPLAVAIAGQLLRHRGFAVERSSYERLSRDRFDELNVSSPSVMMCVVSFDAGEAPPYLRSLLRRLGQIETQPDLVVGLAAPGGDLLDDIPSRRIAVAKTFEEMVNACVAAVQHRGEREEDADRGGRSAA
jgi:hypothetical protein